MKKAISSILITILLLSSAKASVKNIANDSTGVAIFEQFAISEVKPAQNLKLFPVSNYDAINAENNAIQYNKVLEVYLNSALTYSRTGEHVKAQKMILTSAMPISFAYGTDKSNYNCFMNLAKSYFAQSKFTEAKWFFIQANTSSKKMKNKSLELASLMEMAKVKKIIGDKQLALKDYTEAQKLAIKLKSTFNAQLAKANIDALNEKPVKPLKTTPKKVI